MISTLVISLHALSATLIFSAAALILLADPKNTKNRAIGFILALYSLASIAYGLGFNSTSVQQVTPWVLLEIFTTFSTAPAAVLVAITVLRPKVAKNLILTISLWLFILTPPILTFFDITNISQTFFNTPFLISHEKIAQTYSGGYLPATEVATNFGIICFALYLIVFSTMLLIYPSLFVTIQDWRKDQQNSINALILVLVSGIGITLKIGMQDALPITTASLISNALISIGFFIVGIRTIRYKNPQAGSDSWLQLFLKDYPMFTKLTSTTALIVIPAIVFISFTSFSYFQNSLLTAAHSHLGITAHHGAASTIDIIENDLHDLEHLNVSSRSRTLLANRQDDYQDLSKEQIQELIRNRNSQWIGSDMLLISTTLDPSNNNELKLLLEENPNYLSIILTDPFGGLITASENPEGYDFSSKRSYQHVIENQKIYFGPPSWNNESQKFTTEIAMPFQGLRGEILGIVLAEYDLTVLISNLKEFEQNDVQFGLLSSDGTVIPSTGNQPGIYSLPSAAMGPQDSTKTWRTFQVRDKSHLIRTFSGAGSEFKITTPWQIVALQPVSVALAPLSTALVTAVITAGIIISISTIIIISLSQSIARPLGKLTDAATKILGGETDVKLTVNTEDEIGMLAASFNQMTTDLNALLINLEQTIEERTKDLQERAVQLEASALVARQAAEVRDMETLLDLTVNLITEKFGYYHTGIFLLDTNNRFAVLQAANSEGGKMMLARNHKLKVGQVGVVGYAAGMGQPRIAQDVGADVVYYDNPDMPDTRSEMALPLKVRDRVIGVLDVQSIEPNAFSQENIEILQVLADQLALAIDNAWLLENSQKALQELQILYGQDIGKAWQQRLTGKDITYSYDSTGLIKRGAKPEVSDVPGKPALSKPISLRGQVIGQLNLIRDETDTKWTEDENLLIEEILEHTALALENARLVDQIRLRSDQIQLLQEITAMAASILDEKELLIKVAQRLRTSLQVQHCGIVLLDEQKTFIELVSSASSHSNDIKVGHRLLVKEDQLSQLIVHSPDIRILQDIKGEPGYQAFVQTFTTRKTNTLALLPLTIREQVIGAIFLELDKDDRKIDSEEANLFRQISAQISTALESARLFAAEQEGRLAAAALLEITQIASASLDMNQVLNQATNRSAQAIQAHRCTIFLLDEIEKIKPLVSIYADGSEMPEEEWVLLQKRVHETYHDFPLHRLAANLRTPKIISDPPTYSNIPLGWAAEFDIENMLMVPLISQNKVIGSMVFDQINPNLTFKQNQEEIAQTIAGQIATTIENSKLFEQAVHRAERERQVSEITAKIRSSNDPKEIMDTAIKELRLALTKPNEKIKRSKNMNLSNKKTNLPTNGKDQDKE